MNIIIRDLDQTRIKFEAAVRRVGEREATIAFSTALNKEGDKIRTQVRQTVAEQVGVKYGVAKSGVRDTKSSFRNLTYTLTARGRFFGLSHFNPAQADAGAEAAPWGRHQLFERTFLVQVKGKKSKSGKTPSTRKKKARYNIFVRDGSGRFPIRKLWGPAIPKEIMRNASRKAFEDAQPDVLAEATRQIQRIVEGN